MEPLPSSDLGISMILGDLWSVDAVEVLPLREGKRKLRNRADMFTDGIRFTVARCHRIEGVYRGVVKRYGFLWCWLHGGRGVKRFI